MEVLKTPSDSQTFLHVFRYCAIFKRNLNLFLCLSTNGFVSHAEADPKIVFFWDVILSHILSWGETNRNWERFVSLVVEDWDWHVSLCLLMILRYINRRSEPVEWIKEYCVHTPDDDRFIDNWHFICLFKYVLTNGVYNVLK